MNEDQEIERGRGNISPLDDRRDDPLADVRRQQAALGIELSRLAVLRGEMTREQHAQAAQPAHHGVHHALRQRAGDHRIEGIAASAQDGPIEACAT